MGISHALLFAKELFTGKIIVAFADTLFKAEFAVMPNDSKKECDYIVYNYQGKSYKNKLQDKAYQLLTQIYPKPSVDSVTTAPGDSTQL